MRADGESKDAVGEKSEGSLVFSRLKSVTHDEGRVDTRVNVVMWTGTQKNRAYRWKSLAAQSSMVMSHCIRL